MSFKPSKKYTPARPKVAPSIKKQQKTILADVQNAFDFNRLREICAMREVDFKKYANVVQTSDPKKGKSRPFWHADKGSNVLAVCHLDSVQTKRHCYIDQKARVVSSPVLDDRLGAYIICELLPKLGYNFDLLLCTDEERGQSTAALFDTDKKYDFMVEFDRAGEDAVLYQYDGNKQWNAALEESGFLLDWGIFSDISELEHLGCCGVNIGVGYEDYHGKNAYAVLDQMFRNVMRFITFYELNKGKHFEHEPVVRYSGYRQDSETDLAWDAWLDAYDRGEKFYMAHDGSYRPVPGPLADDDEILDYYRNLATSDDVNAAALAQIDSEPYKAAPKGSEAESFEQFFDFIERTNATKKQMEAEAERLFGDNGSARIN